jgi:DNA polymerase-3 subunit delta
MAVAAEGLTLIHGEERYLIDAEAARWLSRARATAGELDVQVIDQPSKLDPVRSALTEVPLFDPQRFVLIRDAPQLSERGRRGSDGPDALVACLEARAPTTEVCLVGHATVTPANVVLQAVARMGARISHHPQLKGRDLRAWADRRLRERSLDLERGGVEHLLTCTGGNLGMLESEIDKLHAYASGGGRIALDTVRALVAGDEQLAVWAVVERLLTRPAARSATAVDTLLDDGVSSQYLLATLAGQLREVLQAQDMLRERGGGANTLIRELRMPSWRAERLARQASAVPSTVVHSWLRELQQLDVGIKSGERNDGDGMRLFALRAARTATHGQRRPARD